MKYFRILMATCLLLNPVMLRAQATDAAALRAAHDAYFQGFPQDRSGVQALASKGNLFAAMMLERTWQRESYGPVSETEAGRWRDAALAGDVPKRLEVLAAKNNGIAMTWLGTANCNGLVGMAKNLTQCVAWYEKGAAQGEAKSQILFAQMLSSGSGVEKNEAEAIRWFRKAADQGDSDAQNGLVFSYRMGKGVPHDEAQSIFWYRKAAEQGNPAAQYNLGVNYWNGTGVPKDKALAAFWFRKAADQNDSDALNAMGLIHYENDDVCAAADTWERAASRHSDGSVYLQLAKLYSNWGDNASAWQSLRLAREKGGVAESDFTKKVADVGTRLDKAEPWRSHIEREFPLLRDTADIEQRKAAISRFFSQIDNKMYVDDGGGTWSDDKLFVGYNEYMWCNQTGHMFVRGNSLDGKYEVRSALRLDPQTGIYYGVDYRVGSVIETFWLPDTKTGEIVTLIYEINKKGKRGALMSNGIQVMQADGRLKNTYFGPFNRKGTTTFFSPVDRSRLPALAAAVKQAEAERKQARENRKSESSGLFRTLIGAAVGATTAGAAGGDANAVLGAALTGAQMFGGDGGGASGNVANAFASTLNSEMAKKQQQDAQQQQFLDDVRRQAEAIDRDRRESQERQRQAQEAARREQQSNAQAAEQARQRAAQQAEQQRLAQQQALAAKPATPASVSATPKPVAEARDYGPAKAWCRARRNEMAKQTEYQCMGPLQNLLSWYASLDVPLGQSGCSGGEGYPPTPEHGGSSFNCGRQLKVGDLRMPTYDPYRGGGNPVVVKAGD